MDNVRIGQTGVVTSRSGADIATAAETAHWKCLGSAIASQRHHITLRTGMFDRTTMLAYCCHKAIQP